MIIWHVETGSGPRFDWARDEEHLRQQLIEYHNDVIQVADEDRLSDDATLEEAIDAVEEYENFSREDFPLPKVFVAVFDSDDGATQTSVHLSPRKAIEWVATEAGVDLDHIAHLDDDAAQEKIADSLSGIDWFVIHEEEIQK